jgi:hypothetical protein
MLLFIFNRRFRVAFAEAKYPLYTHRCAVKYSRSFAIISVAMAEEYEVEEVSNEEKLQIAQHFLLSAPPCQFDEVLAGVCALYTLFRVLILPFAR